MQSPHARSPGRGPVRQLGRLATPNRAPELIHPELKLKITERARADRCQAESPREQCQCVSEQKVGTVCRQGGTCAG
eukprot:950757-Lingulodinium_polyedra.AAC.1